MAQDPESLKIHLNAMRAGETCVLSQREEMLTVEQCADMADAILHAPRLTKVEFSITDFADFKPIADALSARSDLEEITFTDCTPATGVAESMPGIIANKPELSRLRLGSQSFASPEHAPLLAEALKDSCPALKDFIMPAGIRDTRSAQLILQSMGGKNQLESLMLGGPNEIDPDMIAGDIQQFLQNKPLLTQLHLPTDELATDLSMPDAGTLPNLIVFQFGQGKLNDGPIGDLCEHNKQAISTKIAEIAENRPKEPTPDDIWLVHHRKTAAITHGLKTKLPHFVRLVERLPAPPPALNVDALLAGDANGYCPLDNPKLWEKHPNLLAELAETGQLKEETLARTSPKGATLLEYALGFAKDAGAVFATLNQNGICLGKAHFVENGQPTLALQTLLEKSQGKALLNPENWRDNKAELQTTLAAIPQEQKGQLPNRHAFLAAFRQREDVQQMAR